MTLNLTKIQFSAKNSLKIDKLGTWLTPLLGDHISIVFLYKKFYTRRGTPNFVEQCSYSVWPIRKEMRKETYDFILRSFQVLSLFCTLFKLCSISMKRCKLVSCTNRFFDTFSDDFTTPGSSDKITRIHWFFWQ